MKEEYRRKGQYQSDGKQRYSQRELEEYFGRPETEEPNRQNTARYERNGDRHSRNTGTYERNGNRHSRNTETYERNVDRHSRNTGTYGRNGDRHSRSTERYERNEYRRLRRKQQIRRRLIMAAAVAGLAVLVIFLNFAIKLVKEGDGSKITFSMSGGEWGDYQIGNPVKQVAQPLLDVQLLTVNEFSRPGTPTDGVKGVVVHYTANPGSTAKDNRDYFENLKDTQLTQASSNFIIGLDGEIIQCIPTSEIAYASNSRNNDTVSIECCHPDESGQFTEATYRSLVELVAFLCGKFNLNMDTVIRHYDVTEKICPKYFVEHEDAWEAFKADVAKYIEENGE